MSFKASQFRSLIVHQTLQDIGLWSLAAENLLLMTCAQESHMGKYLHQLGSGPALGVYQMEPATYRDIWQSYLKHSPLAAKLRQVAGHRYWNTEIPPEEMIGNLYYATAMTRIHYYRVPHPLPQADDIQGLAEYYKKYYNSMLGAAKVPEVIQNYRVFVQEGE